MRRTRVLILSFLLLGGCSHRYAIHSLESTECAALSETAQEGRCVVFLRGGTGFDVRDLELGADTTTFRVEGSQEIYRFPTCALDSILCRRHVLGALEGFWIGGAVAAVIGAVVGLVVGADSPEHCDGGGDGICITRTQTVWLWVLLGSPVGAVIGALMGGGSGDKVVFYPFPGEPGGASSDTTGEESGSREGLSNKPLQQTAPRDPAPSGGE